MISSFMHVICFCVWVKYILETGATETTTNFNTLSNIGNDVSPGGASYGVLQESYLKLNK